MLHYRPMHTAHRPWDEDYPEFQDSLQDSVMAVVRRYVRSPGLGEGRESAHSDIEQSSNTACMPWSRRVGRAREPSLGRLAGLSAAVGPGLAGRGHFHGERRPPTPPAAVVPPAVSQRRRSGGTLDTGAVLSAPSAALGAGHDGDVQYKTYTSSGIMLLSLKRPSSRQTVTAEVVDLTSLLRVRSN